MNLGTGAPGAQASDPLRRFVLRVARLQLALVALLLIAALLITLWAIVWRNSGHSTGDWALRVPEVILIWMTFIGIGALISENGHVRMDLMIERLSPRGRRIAATLAALFSMLVLGVIAAGAGSMVWQTWQIGQTDDQVFDWPAWILLAPLPVGLVLAIAHLCAGIALLWRDADGDPH